MKLFSFLSLVILSTVLLAVPFSARAETGIAVIDLAGVIEKSVVGKDLQSKFKSRKESLQKVAVAYEKDLRAKEQTLVQDSKTLDKAAFIEKKKNFEVGLKKERQAILNKTIGLEKSKAGALKAIQDKVAEIAAGIAQAKNLQIIVDRSAVVIAHQSLDITGDVIKQLDASMKSAPLK